MDNASDLHTDSVEDENENDGIIPDQEPWLIRFCKCLCRHFRVNCPNLPQLARHNVHPPTCCTTCRSSKSSGTDCTPLPKKPAFAEQRIFAHYAKGGGDKSISSVCARLFVDQLSNIRHNLLSHSHHANLLSQHCPSSRPRRSYETQG
jgi:hypothetical protein